MSRSGPGFLSPLTPTVVAMTWVVAAAVVFFHAPAPETRAQAQRPKPGIAGRPAPELRVDQWFNLPEGKSSLGIADLKGKVVYLYCFQSWCPGCHKYGFPTLVELQKLFKDDKEVVFIAVQTTFEGFDSNTAEKAKATGERYKLTIPVGHSGSGGKRSKLMSAYRTGGTPWTVIIDKSGVVRFNDFHISTKAASALIEKLKTGK